MITYDAAILDEAKPLLPTASTIGAPLFDSNRSSETPLLDWIAKELQEADGLDHHRAMRAARKLLMEACTAVTVDTTNNTQKELLI
jgi:hypothetical protein